MAKEKKNLSWQDLDVAGLTGQPKKDYDAWKKADEAAKTLRKNFEDSVVDAARKKGNLPADKTLRFSYRYGVGVAVDDEGGEKAGAFKV